MNSVSLEDVCAEIHNFFEQSRQFGTFTITDGSIDLSAIEESGAIKPGQYFRVTGSTFNNGVHQYPASGMNVDETFYGGIWPMVVPSAILELVTKINTWQTEHEKDLATLDGPYQSESYKGYSYSLKSGLSDGLTGADEAWKRQFKSALNKWRKIKI